MRMRPWQAAGEPGEAARGQAAGEPGEAVRGQAPGKPGEAVRDGAAGKPGEAMRGRAPGKPGEAVRGQAPGKPRAPSRDPAKARQGVSLRSRVMAQGLLVILLMSAVCLTLLWLGERDTAVIRQALEQKVLTSDYFSAIDALHARLLEYMHTGQPAWREESEAAAALLCEQADALRAYYRHPQFEDQYHRTLALEAAVLRFLRQDAPVLSEASIALYAEAANIMALLTDADALLLAVEKQCIAENMAAFDRARAVRMWALALILLSLSGLCLLVSLRFAHRITAPLAGLTGRVREAAAALPGTAPQLGGGEGEGAHAQQAPDGAAQGAGNAASDEMQILSAAFEHMIYTIAGQMRALEKQYALSEKLKNLELENMRMNMQVAQSELRVTQSLIKPHFLYNCLTTLSSLAYIEGAKKTRDASQQVAAFLRDALGQVGAVIAMEEEVRRIWQYIEIQKLRFGDRIAYAVDLDVACLSARIPAMALQPLVENAIVHGMAGVKGKGRIRLEVRRRAQRLCVIVEDTGKGMPAEVAQALERMARDPGLAAEGQSLGMKCALLQLRSFFEGDVGLLVEQGEAGGARITLDLPFWVGEAFSR